MSGAEFMLIVGGATLLAIYLVGAPAPTEVIPEPVEEEEDE